MRFSQNPKQAGLRDRQWKASRSKSEVGFFGQKAKKGLRDAAESCEESEGSLLWPIPKLFSKSSVNQQRPRSFSTDSFRDTVLETRGDHAGAGDPERRGSGVGDPGISLTQCVQLMVTSGSPKFLRVLPRWEPPSLAQFS